MTQPHPTARPDLLGVEVDGVTRQAALLRGALVVGGLYGAGMVGPWVRRALGQTATSDVDVLNYALTLEELEAAFYRRARRLMLSSEVAGIARDFGDAEQRHVEALRGTIRKLGGTPVKAPRFRFPISDERSFLKLAQTLEDTGVSAYNGAAPSIRSAEVLAAAGSIVQVEARHAAVIRLLRGEQPAPSAFDAPLTQTQVTKAITPLIAK